MVIQIWVFDKYFLENEVSLSFQGKSLAVFVVNNKIKVFK